MSCLNQSLQRHCLLRCGSNGKESAHNAGDPGSIPGWERSPGDGIGNSLQYSCLENSMDRGAWYSPWGHNELDTAEQVHILSFFSLQRQEFLCCLEFPVPTKIRRNVLNVGPGPWNLHHILGKLSYLELKLCLIKLGFSQGIRMRLTISVLLMN